MAKDNSKKQRNSRISSGRRRMQKANQKRRELACKIRRWDRYRQEISSGKRTGSPERWNTAGLQECMSQLDATVKKGVARTV